MGCPQIYAVVQTGKYAGFTAAEMTTEWERYKTALTTAGSRLAGYQVTGESAQFGPRADMTLDGWGREVRAALAQVSPDFIAPQSAVVVRFGEVC